MIHKPKTTKKGSARRRHADVEHAATVSRAIECITTVPKEAIVVTVDQGWVRLEGCVQEWHQRDAVENVVRHLDGVKGVLNLITAEPAVRPRTR